MFVVGNIYPQPWSNLPGKRKPPLRRATNLIWHIYMIGNIIEIVQRCLPGHPSNQTITE